MNEKARQMWEKVASTKFRYEMTPSEEIKFIHKLYDCYEAEDDFSPVYLSIHGDEDNYNNQPYQLIKRVEIPESFHSLTERNDAFEYGIVDYPMWVIEFPDGATVAAYESEIILRCIRENHTYVPLDTKPLSFEEVQCPLKERYYDFYEIEVGKNKQDTCPPYSFCIKADHTPTPEEAKAFLQKNLLKLQCPFVLHVTKISDKIAKSRYDMVRGDINPILQEIEEKEYIVKRYYQSTVTVKASSPEEALEKAGDYEGNFQLLDEDEVEEVIRPTQMRM